VKYSYADYVGLDPAKRPQVREILGKNPQFIDHAKFVFDMYQNDPDSAARQWALDMLGKLGIGVTDHQALTLSLPDHKLIELNSDKGRVYTPDELKSQALYLTLPKEGQAYLNGETSPLARDERYARLLANGKLLLGQIIGTGLEQSKVYHRKGVTTYLVCYSFLTPAGKLVVGEHGGLKEAQLRDRPAPATTVAVLYATDNDYDIL